MAAGMRGGLGLFSWLLVAGALTMMFFVVLSGVKDHSPLNKVYFLQADTSSIPGARAVSQWTYFYVCGQGNSDCGKAVPALPFGYAWIGNTKNVPSDLVGKFGKGTTSMYYYYMWRFGWVFYLIATVFAALAVISGLLSFTRIGSGISSLIVFMATGFQTLAAILMTVTFVKARDEFRRASMTSQIGTYAFGFTWGAAVALFIASVLFFFGCCIGRDKGDRVHNSGGMFRRNRSTRSRGSFVDTESTRRVKEEYP